MKKYSVLLSPRALRDIEDIYEYIANEKMSIDNAKAQTDRIKEAVIGLETMPDSHQERQVGRYANQGYRQLLIDNYIGILRIDEESNTVYVLTIQYQRRNI